MTEIINNEFGIGINIETNDKELIQFIEILQIKFQNMQKEIQLLKENCKAKDELIEILKRMK